MDNYNISKLSDYFQERENMKLKVGSDEVYLDYVSHQDLSSNESLYLVFSYKGMDLRITIKGTEDDNCLKFLIDKKVQASTVIVVPISNFSTAIKHQLEGFIEKVNSGEINDLELDFEWDNK